MDIKPWVVDVSSAINFESPEDNVVEYRALMFYNGSWVTPQSESQTGYVIMSSNLIYYDYNSSSAAATTTTATSSASSSSPATASSEQASISTNDVEEEGEGKDEDGPSAAARDFLAVESAEASDEVESATLSIKAFSLSVIVVLAFFGALSVLLVAKRNSNEQPQQLPERQHLLG